MKGNAPPRFLQNIRHPKKFFSARAVENVTIEADFEIDFLFQDSGEILIAEQLEG
jgi:hypothetical protein